MNAVTVLSNLYELIRLRSAEVADWTRRHTTVADALRSKPRAGAPVPDLSTRMDDRFPRLGLDASIAEALMVMGGASRVLVCIDDGGKPVAALTAQDLVRFVSAETSPADGIFAPGERSIRDLLAGDPGISKRWTALTSDAPLIDAVKALTVDGCQVLVGTNRSDGTAVGVIRRAHRRY